MTVIPVELRDALAKFEDSSSRLVLADWLLERGDERGELIINHDRLAHASDDESERLKARHRDIVARHLKSWAHGLPPNISVKWKHGFIVSAEAYQVGSKQLEQLFKHPAWAGAARLFVRSNELDRVLPLVANARSLELLVEGGCSSRDFAEIGRCTTKLKLLHLDKIEEEGLKALVQAELDIQGLSLNANDNSIGPTGAAILTAAKGLRNLQFLNLGRNEIGDQGAAALATNANLKNLSTLILNQNNLGSAGACSLAESTAFPRLRKLHLGGNKLGAAGLVALSTGPALADLAELVLDSTGLDGAALGGLSGGFSLKRLTTLGLAFNDIGSEGASELANSSTFVELKALDLQDNAIGVAGARALARSAKLERLETLDLDGNQIGSEGTHALSLATGLASLSRLDLGSNLIETDGIRALATAPKLSALRHLRLNENQLDKHGLRALAHGRSLCLTELELGGCEIHQNVDALACGAGLSKLRRLSLRSNKIEGAYLAALSHQWPKQLTSLDLDVNRVGNEGMRAIATSLPKLEQLHLSNNEIGDQGIEVFVAATQSCLTVLTLESNNIGDRGVKAIANAQSLRYLDHLDLHDNEIGDEGARALAAATSLNSLTRLELGANNFTEIGKRILDNSWLAHAILWTV